MRRNIGYLVVAAALVAGCGKEQPSEPALGDGKTSVSPPASALPQPNYDIPMRNFAPVKIGPYDVQPMFEEEIENGHFNIKIAGGEVKAVRIWVGPEDAEGVVVVKTEIENDYHHGHVEVPSPIPADVRLWIEIETPEGETMKGSTPLAMAS